jgi:phosphomethylpyrimidine synthase
MPTVYLKTKEQGLEVGQGYPTRVNCNVGINIEEQRAYEIDRLESILNSGCLPDTFMDLSIGISERPIYKEIQQLFDCPVGIVPSYLFPPKAIVSKQGAMDIIRRLADDGIAFFTLHLTASIELLKQAQESRKIPITSRGGWIVLQQQLLSGEGNIWQSCLSEIIDLVKEYGIVISLGSTFRPAGISDACDEVHIKETEEQLKICRFLQAEGVQVMVENVGHISLDRLDRHCELLRQFDAPIMPLGPTPTDSAVGMDQVAAAVGASFMGYKGCAHIINCVTRSEHSASSFTIEETLEAIKVARLAAHIIDVSRGMSVEEDYQIYDKRAATKSCLAGAEGECSRCALFCPLRMKS